MSSNDAGDLPRGTQVVLLETREDPSGMPRARVAFPPLGLPIQTAVMQGMVASIGWVSWLGRDGEANLLAVDDPAAAVAIESSAKAKARTAAKRAAAKAASVLADNQVPLKKPLTQHEMFAFATAAGQRALGINSESSSDTEVISCSFLPSCTCNTASVMETATESSAFTPTATACFNTASRQESAHYKS